MKKFSALAMMFFVSCAVNAEPKSHLDIYFAPSAKLDLTIPGFGSADDDGDGFGIRGLGRADSVAFIGEYQSISYDDFDIDVDQIRLGVGLVGQSASGLFIEYADLDFDNASADGFGIHGRLEGSLADAVTLYGQAGYLFLSDDQEDIKGPEFSVGLNATVSERVGVFGDFRRTSLEGEDSGIEFEFSDIRIGVRLWF